MKKANIDNVVCPNYYTVLKDQNQKKVSDVVVKPTVRLIHDHDDTKYQKVNTASSKN